ncbi:hypothetical protein M409DRAFT_29135 [Zasmidium cellare ATCC 36951]|uniref:NADP-dependent oxidoreductase domain-containing protein n=1 Tax=Zasmidium cellare ATCC 36951 TaxID=1080233 RepID=A0A6A6C0M2_ZASCE|nr:uncharacterized protein M409DRAFT_29135 [Zasmidium cellare ATCC 36951]KAF2160515.1 hypothetical protein M409DRAFT_29135 [Zasmidium cellare ATCC 36951]
MPKIICGLMGTSVASGSSSLSGSNNLRPFLQMLTSHGVKELDTARVYNSGKSEEDLGTIPTAQENFLIATKAPGFSLGSLSYDKIIENCSKSLAALKQDRIGLYYFHGPDRETKVEESCRAINDLFKEGKIERFGVSNCSREEVEEIHGVCKTNGWLVPTVYQGGYNPLLRTTETALFPTLRRLGMVFYAYSPLGGGYFSRPTEQLRTPPAGGRMDQMKVFSSIYVNNLSLKLHEMLEEACKKEDLSLKTATLRYLTHHSALGKDDGIILGASSLEQMEQNLEACEGDPLPDVVVSAFETLWAEYRKAYNPAYCV